MERMRTRAWALAAVCVMYAAVAAAQATLPRENHYNVYRTSTITYVKPIGLLDQFGPIDVTDFVLERFANPAEKIHPETGEVFPIIDPIIHQMWWRIHAPQPARTVVGIDQFGSSEWRLGDAVYLINPALKNVADPAGGPLPPVWNHYVCYDAIGPTVGRPVIVVDQFGQNNVIVIQGKLFCNPAEKRADGIVYPVIDFAAHLACYIIQNATPMTRSITAVDQFGYWQLQTYDNDCLCVPALKEHVIGTEESTWGRIKAMYR